MWSVEAVCVCVCVHAHICVFWCVFVFVCVLVNTLVSAQQGPSGVNPSAKTTICWLGHKHTLVERARSWLHVCVCVCVCVCVHVGVCVL